MENTEYIIYFMQFFINIPLMFAIIIGQYLGLDLHRYTLEQLLLLGYFTIIYMGMDRSQLNHQEILD
jgi:hypothetical protein